MAKELKEYNRKRDFEKTGEPAGIQEEPEERLRFVVQHHLARKDHYDFRLEWDGALLSWAIPKGPSYDTRDKRLAVHVEDHPLEYRNFEGTIPKGEYGGGAVMLWDEGYWEPYGNVDEGLDKGSLKFVLKGKRLKGKWALVRLKAKTDKPEDNWLLLKEKDDYVKPEDGISGLGTSIRTGRTMEEIEAGGEPKITVTKNPFAKAGVQLAKLVNSAPEGEDWLFEIKYDGYRIVAYIEGGSVRLMTRNGKDYTKQFQDIANSLNDWSAGRTMVLDGEMVIADARGRTDFQALQSYMRKSEGKNLTYAIFDLLALDGVDLRGKRLTERKETLEALMKDSPKSLYYSKHVRGNGKAGFLAACKANLEGVVGKKADSVYSGTRNGDWIKLKCDTRQEFVIGGYMLSDKKTSGISSLLLGVYEGEELVYAGRAGTGLGERSMKELGKKFESIKRDSSPFRRNPATKKNEKITWLEPVLVAEVKFAEWTGDNMLRQASFKGLRTDKAPRDIRREDADNETLVDEVRAGNTQPEEMQLEETQSEGMRAEKAQMAKLRARDKQSKRKMAEKIRADETKIDKVSVDELQAGKVQTGKKPREEQLTGRDPEESTAVKGKNITIGGIRITNPDKVLFDDPEIKKADVVRYYAKVSERMLPYVGNRILSIVRCPKGISEACFFKKHPGPGTKGVEIMPIVTGSGETEDYFYITNASGLISEAQMGTLEFHTWGSRADDLEKPDIMVFDLDPDEGMDIERVRQGVRDVKGLLDQLSLSSFLKISGGKGYHVVVPLKPSVGWDAFHDFARHIAEVMEQKWPDRYTSNVRKDRRKNRIFIDWIRNGRGATSIAPYSIRARKGARVSMPITWEELDTTAPDGIDMDAALQRIGGQDPWKDFYRTEQRLR
ncbi:MAG TPA: DNA ligase D [Clostridia bacterium]|nr:DNA ligase D [Clostridia bacterium]